MPPEGQNQLLGQILFTWKRGRAPGEDRPKAAHAFFAWKRGKAPGEDREIKRRTPFYGLLFTWRADNERAASGIQEGGDTRTPFSPAAGILHRLRRTSVVPCPVGPRI